MRREANQELLAALRATPRRVEDLLRGLARRQLTTPPAPGKWSILEILCHLRDAEIEIYQPEYATYEATPTAAATVDESLDSTPAPVARVISAAPIAPTPSDIDPDLRALVGLYRHQSAAAMLRDWKKARKTTLARVERLMTPTHSSDLESLLDRHGAHDRAHLMQIESILERQAIFARLAATPRALRERLEALAVAAPSGAVGAGSTVLFLETSRMRDFEQLMLSRYVLILEQEHPPLRPFDTTPLDPRRGESEIGALLRDFETLRAETLDLLAALGAKLWQRRGAHPRRGDLTIAELVAQHLDHDAERLAVVRAQPLPRIRLAPDPDPTPRISV